MERAEHTKTQERFNQSVNFIKDKLKAHKTENLAQLNQLIEKATLLLEETDTESALAEHHELLNQWKKVGITFRADQQKCWQRFKDIGDTIYARKKQRIQEDKKSLYRSISLCQ